MPRPSKALLTATLVIFLGCFAALFIFTPFSERMEDKLYDLRSRLVFWETEPSPQVVTLAISENTTHKQLAKIIEKTLATGPRRVGVILPPEIYPYREHEFSTLIANFSKTPNLHFGVFGQTDHDFLHIGMPPAMIAFYEKFGHADIRWQSKSSVVRKITSRYNEPKDSLLWQLSQDFITLDRFQKTLAKKPYINYSRLDSSPSYQFVDDDFRGKVVIIGVDSHLYGMQPLYVNTPWQADGDKYLTQGESFLRVYGLMVANLIDDEWLHPAPASVNILQTLLVIFITIAGARLGTANGIFVFGISLTTLFIIHSLLFATLHIQLAAAPVFFFAALATLGSLIIRLQWQVRARIERQSAVEFEEELANMHAHFLDRLAIELDRLNKNIREALLKVDASATPTASTAMARALSSNEELSDYLNGMEQFANMQESSRHQVFVKVNLKNMITRILKKFDHRIQEEKMHINVDVHPEAFVSTDAFMCEQILYNLISNAVKYSPKAGEVRIHAEPIKGYWELSVIDSGPGIPVEYREQVFEKFYRIKNDQVYKIKGNGLGLYLSRFFATMIGAKLEIGESISGAKLILKLKAIHG